jgi:hypothetical protein
MHGARGSSTHGGILSSEFIVERGLLLAVQGFAAVLSEGIQSPESRISPGDRAESQVFLSTGC